MEVTYYMGSTILQGDWKFHEGHGLIEDALCNLKDDPMEKKNVLMNNPELLIACAENSTTGSKKYQRRCRSICKGHHEQISENPDSRADDHVDC